VGIDAAFGKGFDAMKTVDLRHPIATVGALP
jgi:hypothetical protein